MTISKKIAKRTTLIGSSSATPISESSVKSARFGDELRDFVSDVGVDLKGGSQLRFEDEKRPSIVLAEDVVTINRVVAHALHTADAEVSVAYDGKEAVVLAAALY